MAFFETVQSGGTSELVPDGYGLIIKETSTLQAISGNTLSVSTSYGGIINVKGYNTLNVSPSWAPYTTGIKSDGTLQAFSGYSTNNIRNFDYVTFTSCTRDFVLS